MVLAFGAAQASSLGLGDFLGTGISPRMDESSYHVLDARQNSTTASATVNMFIDAQSNDFEYAASIITACVDQTVYALQCTSAPVGVDPSACGPNAGVVTLTSAASEYSIFTAGTTTIQGYAVTGTAIESCALAGTTAATCSASVKGTADGTAVSTSGVETLSSADYYRFNVQITGGAEKTVNPTATCAVKGAAVSINTKNVAMLALAGVIGIVNIVL